MLIRLTRDTIISAGRPGKAGTLEDVPEAIGQALVRLGKAVTESHSAARVTPEAPVIASSEKISLLSAAAEAPQVAVSPSATASGLAALPWRELRQLAAGLGLDQRGNRSQLIHLIENKQKDSPHA
jgi:hypothetical protein